VPAHDTPAEHLVRLRSALNLSLVGSVLFVLGVGSGAGADVRNDVAWPALPATIALGLSCAGFDGHHQATEDQRWQHHGSTRRNFGSERSG